MRCGPSSSICQLDLTPLAAEMGQADREHAAPGEPRLGHRRPLDEGDRVGVEVVVEQRRVLVLEPAEAVEVEVGDRQPGRGSAGRS